MCVLQRGALNSKFLNYINKHLLPVFDKVHETILEDHNRSCHLYFIVCRTSKYMAHYLHVSAAS